MVVGLGFVSLTIDMVSDGAMSVGGAVLGQLGASAVLVGLVTGGADAVALVLRLVTGPLADRTGAYWGFTIAGYAMSAISVPLLAVTPVLGAAALGVASFLFLAERTGKAVRAPAKTVLLADPAGAVGRGRGFGVHKMLDQTGAFAGPLVVAAIAAASGAYWPAFLVLVVPGVVAMVLLGYLRARVPDPSVYRRDGESRPAVPSGKRGAARLDPAVRARFLAFASFAALTTFGLLTFGVISFHLNETALVPLAGIPLVFAFAMAVGALAALATGWAYDRVGPAVLFLVPLMTAFVPGWSLGGSVWLVVAGVALWGAATGIQDSTVKALVADMIPPEQRGSAYGIFAVFQGAAALLGASVAGALYRDVPLLVTIVAVLQGLALVLLVAVVRGQRRDADRSAPGRRAGRWR